MATPSTPSVNMSSSTQISDSQAAMQKLYPNMTTAQYNSYVANKTNFFKGTVAVCVTYAVFAAGLLLVTLFSDSAKEFVGDTIMPFTITFVIGTIITVAVVIMQVVNYKPSIPASNIYDKDVCPDYWILEQTPDSELKQASTTNQPLLKYRCRPDPNVYNYPTFYDSTNSKLSQYQNNNLVNALGSANTIDKTGVYTGVNQNIYGHNPINVNANTSASQIRYALPNTNTDLTNLAKTQPALANLLGGVGSGATKSYYLQDMYGNTAIGSTPIWNSTNDPNATNAQQTMMCDMVYPSYLSAKDYLDFPDKPNQYRCAWAKQCGIPWTTACPDSNDTLPTDININSLPSNAPGASVTPPPGTPGGPPTIVFGPQGASSVPISATGP